MFVELHYITLHYITLFPQKSLHLGVYSLPFIIIVKLVVDIDSHNRESNPHTHVWNNSLKILPHRPSKILGCRLQFIVIKILLV